MAGSSFISLNAAAGPMLPGFMRLAGTPLEPPQVSVMPQTSSIGTPSARYQRIRSAEIGAAPVNSTRERWMPIILRTLFSASQPATWYCSLSQALTGCWASTRSAICVPTPMPQP